MSDETEETTVTAETAAEPAPPEFPEASGVEVEPGKVDEAANVEILKDVSLRARVELGRGEMYLRDILRLTEGSVVELEKNSGDPLDIYVSGRLIARGEVLVLNDNFCVRITEILSPEECFRVKGS